MPLSRAQCYKAQIFCAEYEIEEMIIAFGIEHVRNMIEQRYSDLQRGTRYKSRHKRATKPKHQRGIKHATRGPTPCTS